MSSVWYSGYVFPVTEPDAEKRRAVYHYPGFNSNNGHFRGFNKGHLELHRDMITSSVHVDKNFPVLMRDTKAATGIELVEIQANQFAAELLMPQAKLDEALASKPFDIDDDDPIEELAKKFKVSKQALEYRIRNR